MNKNKALLAGAAMVALSMPLMQREAEAASANINASAIVVSAIALASKSPLHFGAMSITAAGTLSVSTAGARSAGAGGIKPITGGGLEKAGAYTLTMPNAAANFTVSALPLTLGTTKLFVTKLTMAFPGVATAQTFTSGNLSATNQAITGAAAGADIKVGGVLKSNAAVAAGTYSGAITLTANYN